MGLLICFVVWKDRTILKCAPPILPIMKIAVVSNLDTGMMDVIERIREKALSLNVGMNIAPVTRIIDLPMAVRRMGERRDIDSILVAVDFPELGFEHDAPLVKGIKAEIGAIAGQVGKPVSMDLMSEKLGEITGDRIEDVLNGMVEKDAGNPF